LLEFVGGGATENNRLLMWSRGAFCAPVAECANTTYIGDKFALTDFSAANRKTADQKQLQSCGKKSLQQARSQKNVSGRAPLYPKP